MATAVYIRVSSVDQNADGQEAAIRQWIRGRGLQDIRWYRDEVSANDLAGRKEFRRLREAVDAGKIDTVIVYKLDRLMRDMVKGMNLLSQWCNQGVRIVSVTQQVDLDGVIGRMVATLLLAFAELENDYRRERQMAGIQAAKARGVYKNRPPRGKKFKRANELINSFEGDLKPKDLMDLLGMSERSAHRYLYEYRDVKNDEQNRTAARGAPKKARAAR